MYTVCMKYKNYPIKVFLFTVSLSVYQNAKNEVQ